MLRINKFINDESGVTAIEYALIASLIAVFIIVAVQSVGTQVSTVFNEIGTTLK
jgi:pilus assembly protein Flp/PilA